MGGKYVENGLKRCGKWAEKVWKMDGKVWEKMGKHPVFFSQTHRPFPSTSLPLPLNRAVFFLKHTAFFPQPHRL